MTASDRRPTFFGAYEHAADVVAAVEPDQLGLPTPCSRFDVQSLVDHIVGAGFRAAAMGRGEAPSGDGFPHVPLGEAPDQLRQAGKDAQAAWTDADLSATLTMPWGETYTFATIVDMYLTELATHAWDLAASTGNLPRLEAELAPPTLQAAHSMLRPEYRNMVEEGSPFGSEVPAPDDASDWERLAAFMAALPSPAGRAPVPGA
jgi:uncharacterized protein (TIGR03086 family)